MDETQVVDILLVEDSAADATLIVTCLERGSLYTYRIEHAEWLNGAALLVQNRSFDAVLLDLSLKDSHGIDTVISMKRAAPNTPIIVLSGREDIEIARKTVECGAQSFVVKRGPSTAQERQAYTDILERELVFAIVRNQNETTQRMMSRESIRQLVRQNEQLDNDTRPTSPPPAPAAPLFAKPIAIIEEGLTKARLTLQKNYPNAAVMLNDVLTHEHVFQALAEMRAQVALDDEEPEKSRHSQSISEYALKAVRKLSERGSAGDEIETPEDANRVLLGIIQRPKLDLDLDE